MSLKKSLKNYRKNSIKKLSSKKSTKITTSQIQYAISHQLSILHRPNIDLIPYDCPQHICTYIQPKDIDELKKEGIKFNSDMNIDFLLIHDLKVIDNI